MQFQARAGSERVNIFLDGTYAFSLAADIGMPLREGQVLDEDAVRELQTRDDAERAYQHALHFLAPRPRSMVEVRRRLAEYGHEPTAIDAALQRMDQSGLVDDRQFADYWVGQRQTFHPRGPRALQAELRQKGVDRETAAAAIAETSTQQEDAAYRAGERKARSLAALDERAFAQTMYGYLVRRGFDYQVVRTATRRLWTERGGDSDLLDQDDA